MDLGSIYWIVLASGFLLLVVAVAFDGLLHFGDDGSVTPAIGAFLLLFGMAGVVCDKVLGFGAPASLASAALSGTAGGVGFYLLVFRFLKSRESTLSDRREDAVGKHAEVSLPIQAGALGQITFSTPSGRTSAPARSAGGESIPQGTLVEVIQAVGTTYVVRKADLPIERK